MDFNVKSFTKHSIRSLGLDEYWLQDKIYNEPSILGLGDNVQSIRREKVQSSGGKVDIMLFDQDQNTMYEVEVMLGDTDPSHIIRTLEYWDLERRKYPQRQHYAVLVAEGITRRFYNVIQLLSMNFPLIAIQVEVLKIEESYALNFVKVLNVYEEIEMDLPVETVDKQYWSKNYDWILHDAIDIENKLKPDYPTIGMNFVKSYVALMIDGKQIIFFHRRAKPNYRVEVTMRYTTELVEELKDFLNHNNVSFEYNERYRIFIFNLNEKVLKTIDKQFKEFLTKIFAAIIKGKSESDTDND